MSYEVFESYKYKISISARKLGNLSFAAFILGIISGILLIAVYARATAIGPKEIQNTYLNTFVFYFDSQLKC